MAVVAHAAPGAPPGVPESSPFAQKAPDDVRGLGLAPPPPGPPPVPGGIEGLNAMMPQLSINDPAQASANAANLAAMMWQMTQQNPGLMNNMMGGMPGFPPPAWGSMPMMPPVPGASAPTLNVRVDGLKFEYQLTEDDVRKVFSRYGSVRQVVVDRDGTGAAVSFDDPTQMMQALRDLDGKQLAGMSGAFLRVELAPAPYDPAAALAAQMGQMGHMGQMPGYPPPMMGAMPGFAPMPPQGSPASPAGRGKKYTCKLEVGIENESEFRVGSRVIQVARQIWQDRLFQDNDGKTRLRGKGCGGQHEAEEPLALCISCRDQMSFDKAVAYGEQQIRKIQADYMAFCEQKGRPVPDLMVKVSKKGSHLVGPQSGGVDEFGFPTPSAGSHGAIMSSAPPPRGERPPSAPEEAEIERLIEERNEARKASNFKRSDEIRDWLKANGVVLMDEKGARGNFKGVQVTKWRYWRP